MALFITIELNPTPTQTGGDDYFQPAVIGVVRVVNLLIVLLKQVDVKLLVPQTTTSATKDKDLGFKKPDDIAKVNLIEFTYNMNYNKCYFKGTINISNISRTKKSLCHFPNYRSTFLVMLNL